MLNERWRCAEKSRFRPKNCPAGHWLSEMVFKKLPDNLGMIYVPEDVSVERRQLLNHYAGLRYKAVAARERPPEQPFTG